MESEEIEKIEERRSKDKEVNREGKRLLEMLREVKDGDF